ncbi:MAG: hybrid sensor histidine kinase/response regulator [Thermoguttaceae bacterium]
MSSSTFIYTLSILSVAVVPVIVLVSLCMMGVMTYRAWQRQPGRTVLVVLWMIFGVMLVGGCLWLESNVRTVHTKRQRELTGFAKVVAAALEELGHAEIVQTMSPDDPKLIAIERSMLAWLQTLPEVAAIYTIRRTQSGEWVFVVCPACDLNRDDIYGDNDFKEYYVPLNAPFDLADEDRARWVPCLKGESVFSFDRFQDEWGTWIAAAEPLYNDSGTVDAICVLDFWADQFDIDVMKARLVPQVMMALTITIFLTITNFLLRRWWKAAEMQRYATLLETHWRQHAQSNREANRVAEDHNLFLAKMSHEVRTPITSILGYTEILDSETTSPEEYDGAASAILRNTEHLLSILNDILDFSKIEANKINIVPTAVAVGPFFDYFTRHYTPLCHQRHIGYSCCCASPVPETIFTDQTQLRHAILNILDNAVKFTHHGGIAVTLSWCDTFGSISAQTPWQRMGLFRIDIHDTGIGINNATLQSLFHPFAQAETTTMNRTFGGTGLGLAISHGLVKLIGGDIQARSTIGHGTTFTILLPQIVPSEIVWSKTLLRDGGGESVVASDPKTPPPPVPTLPLARTRILLAEDSPDSRRLLELMLIKAGAEVVVVENGLEALERITENWYKGESFDVALIDMQMPIMDGYTAIRILRGIKYSRPLIALTAFTLPSEIQLCYVAGCDGYATKPIHREELIETVLRYRSHGPLDTPTTSPTVS